MAESSEDLREQVARLLFETEMGGEPVDPGSPLRLYREQVDALLPLFATRERAAAEKAFAEGQISGKRFGDRQLAAFKIGRPDLPGPMSPNPYTVRIQLEGDEA